MNYTKEEFKLEEYNFTYAHWSHPYVNKITFTLEDIQTQTSYLNKGDIVIDIGAFTGDTPTLYANAVGSEGKVISFEANPNAYEILEANQKLNPHLNIIPINKAITEVEGTYTFHYSDKDFCNGGFAAEIDRGIGATGHVIPLQVHGVNLTEWLKEYLPANEWGKIAFIKIDTEGYDYKILRSNKELFTKIRPILEVELYPALSIREVKEFYHILQELGYDCFQQHKERDCSLKSLSFSLDEDDFIRIFKNIKSGEDIVAYPKEKVPKNKKKKKMPIISPTTISLIIPSYNNLKHLKNAYTSIRKYYPQVELILLNDGSTDGTQEWLDNMEDNYTIKYKSVERVGHTILYDKGIDLATNDIVGILHADMIIGPNYIENLVKHLDKGKVICATRVEPPIHPEGKEKIIRNFGFDFDDLDLNSFENFVIESQQEFKGDTTKGIFAPWIIYKEDFQRIGGHDSIFAPFGYEDSDIFNRWVLVGYEMIQSRDSFVYHLTCRGHRWNAGVGIDNSDYKDIMDKCRKDFLRKWGSWVQNDEFQHPIIPPKYNIAYVVKNCNLNVISVIEPWCDRLYIEDDMQVLTNSYIETEQKNTSFDLSKRVFCIGYNDPIGENDIVIEFDATQLTQQNFQLLQQLPDIIKESGEIGKFELDIFTITIVSLIEYQNDLIILKN
jgi:FkbM family methyltransferase